MTLLTPRKLLDLGFEKVDVTAEESGDTAFHYYTLDVGPLSLISSESDSEDLRVFFFDSMWFTEDYDVLIDLINAAKKLKEGV